MFYQFQIVVALSVVVACTQAGIIDGGHGYGGYAAAPVAYAAPVAKAVDYYVSNIWFSIKNILKISGRLCLLKFLGSQIDLRDCTCTSKWYF